jgi:HEPN domain-containing protein
MTANGLGAVRSFPYHHKRWKRAGSRFQRPATRNVPVNRLEWQQLAERRLLDAKALLDTRRWSAAYYLAGYAVECGLKSCVLARVAAAAEVIFEDRRFSEKCWTHSIEALVKLAGLEAVRSADTSANHALRDNWLIVKDWSETSRYETKSHWVAKKLYKAITNKTNGVMPWIRVRW